MRSDTPRMCRGSVFYTWRQNVLKLKLLSHKYSLAELDKLELQVQCPQSCILASLRVFCASSPLQIAFWQEEHAKAIAAVFRSLELSDEEREVLTNSKESAPLGRQIEARIGKGEAMEAAVRQAWSEGRQRHLPGADRKVAYAVWRNPWMWAGEDAYIQAVLRWWGWTPWPTERRYPERPTNDLVKAGVEEVLLPSEPFPFKEEHRAECAGLPSRLVVGEAFSWYGSRMRQVPNMMAAWTDSRPD